LTETFLKFEVTPNDDLEQLIGLAARLNYESGLGQEEIAHTIGISRSKVSRLLTKARELGIVQIHIKGYEPRNRALEEKLQDILGLKHAIVINIPNQMTTAHVRRTIGYFAAPFIAEIIQSHNTIGTAGGRTLSELIRQIEGGADFTGGIILTLMGHIGPKVTGIDAFELSYLLAQRLGKTQYTLNAPAFSPDLDTRNVFMNHEQVNSVFELFNSLDVALVGIGALGESVWIERNVITTDDLPQLQDAGAIGEMVGRFFDKDGIECETPFRGRVMSIELCKLAEVPEVVAITNGSVRSEAIIAARNSNLIKSLVIDDIGARAVIDKALSISCSHCVDHANR
jgi:deoxyribonucleoside regulator